MCSFARNQKLGLGEAHIKTKLLINPQHFVRHRETHSYNDKILYGIVTGG